MRQNGYSKGNYPFSLLTQVAFCHARVSAFEVDEMATVHKGLSVDRSIHQRGVFSLTI